MMPFYYVRGISSIPCMNKEWQIFNARKEENTKKWRNMIKYAEKDNSKEWNKYVKGKWRTLIRKKKKKIKRTMQKHASLFHLNNGFCATWYLLETGFIYTVDVCVKRTVLVISITVIRFPDTITKNLAISLTFLTDVKWSWIIVSMTFNILSGSYTCDSKDSHVAQ